MQERQCRCCNQTLSLDSFYASDKNKCKECIKTSVRTNRAKKIEYYREYDRQRADLPKRVEARKEYSKTEAYKQSHIEANKKYGDIYPNKTRARTAVNNALKSGELKRSPCEVCGNPKSEGHHEDYSLPLDVTWLCDAHHKMRHRELNQAKRQGYAPSTIEQFIAENEDRASA
jgi:hypothetical protein